ncbi:MAG TPA: D-alanyl-D-alanine carboxypeptidase/D-alanyl-D-alanine-endopeptidase [Thermoanaerobaculia bacterium]|nr:D-alanyl-D-alanine carboxypeptidase/D-alanyl-D-alanine-endopeptidase [Thermoanaerobaculia bacterium]
MLNTTQYSSPEIGVESCAGGMTTGHRFSPTSTRRLCALLAAFLFILVQSTDAAAPKKKAQAKKTIAASPDRPVASGNTLEERLASLLRSQVAVTSTTSIQIVEVETGRVVGERNSHQAVTPASNMKLFTTAAALDLLGADFEFRTTVSVRGEVDSQGTLRGDVKVTGRGDPTIGGRFHDGQATAVIQRWAEELKRSGVRTIGGNLIFEHGYFDTEYVHPSWPKDQLVNWYEAPVAALSMQEGCVMVRVLPSKPGARAIVRMEPPNRYMTVENSCVTGAGRGVFITRKLSSNDIIVRGNVPARSGATEVFVTVMNPLHYFANVAHDTFERSGIRVLGQVQLVPRDPNSDWRTVSEHRTPLAIVNFVINKKSQNHYAEQLLKTIGAETRNDGSFAGGSAAIHHWLVDKLGVDPAHVSQADGSGMSRLNQATASAFIAVLRHVWKTPHRREFVSSMPYSGESDSRLRRRLGQQPYARQVYAKTGYISGVIGLSGYVHAGSGKVYAFSFLFNSYRTGVWGVYNLQDELLKEIIRNG